jgi:uncharacterized membrane protein (DUF106 family)
MALLWKNYLGIFEWRTNGEFWGFIDLLGTDHIILFLTTTSIMGAWLLWYFFCKILRMITIDKPEP